MNISISFVELSDYINRHYGKQVAFSKVSDKEFCASYSQKILFKTIQDPVSIKIEDVKADSVAIAYNGGFGIDMIIAGTLSFLKAKLRNWQIPWSRKRDIVSVLNSRCCR